MSDPHAPTPEDQVRSASLDRLRGRRNRPDRTADLGGAIAMGQGIAKRARAVGAVAHAWETCVPEDLRRQSELLSFAGGIVRVGVASGAARYKMDRWLKGGGETALRREARAPVTRVRLVTT